PHRVDPPRRPVSSSGRWAEPHLEGAVPLAALEHLDVALGVSPAEHVELRSPTLAVESPAVGGAHQLVAVDDAVGGEVGPLVRAPGIHRAGLTGGTSPEHEHPVADLGAR